MSHEMNLKEIGDEVVERLDGTVPTINGAVNIYVIAQVVIDVLVDNGFVDWAEPDT